MFTKAFWMATLERAIRGGAAGAIAVFTVGQISDLDHLVNAGESAGIGFAVGFVTSTLFSLAGSQVGDKGSPSLTKSETLAPQDSAV